MSHPFLAPPEMPDEIGRLGPYRILGELGRGGMGVVYRAEDPRLKRQLAIKVLLPQAAGDPQAVARFRREAQAQAKVEHDHIIPIWEVEEANGVVYIAMPLLKGQTLSSALKQNARPPIAELVRIGREMAEGLAAAHAVGLIHRDIKPANVWLEGSKRRVKILDFGLARAAAITSEKDDAITVAGAIMGTPAYMAPEQARSQPVDHRGDIFALGVVLHQMAIGKMPFTGASAFDIMAAVVSHDPPPVGALVPNLPPELSDLIQRLLAKNPAARPQSCEAVAEELEAIERGLAVAPVRLIPLAAIPGAPVAPDPWANIDTTFVEAGATMASRARPEKPVRTPFPNWLWPAVGVFGLVALVAVVSVVAPWGKPKPPKPPVQPKSKDKDTPAQPREARIIPLPTELTCLALSPNGKLAAVGGQDGIVYLIDPATGAVRDRLVGHTWRVLSVAFSADGRWLASGGQDRAARLWDLKDEKHRILGQSGTPIWAIGFSADGTTLAACGTETGWDTATGAPNVRFETAFSNGFARLPGTDRVASAYFFEKQVLVFDITTGKQVARLTGLSEVRAVAAAPDGRRLAIALGIGGDVRGTDPPIPGADFSVRVWDVTADKQTLVLKGHDHVAYHVAWAPVGDRIASASYDKTVRVWDAETGTELHVLKHDAPVLGVAFGPNGRTLVSASYDRTVRVWELPPPKAP